MWSPFFQLVLVFFPQISSYQKAQTKVTSNCSISIHFEYKLLQWVASNEQSFVLSFSSYQNEGVFFSFFPIDKCQRSLKCHRIQMTSIIW